MCSDLGLLPTLSDGSPIRTHPVVIVIAVVVVDVATGRNAYFIQRTTYVVTVFLLYAKQLPFFLHRSQDPTNMLQTYMQEA